MLIYESGAMSTFFYSGEYHKAKEWRHYAKEKLTECGFKIFDPTKNSESNFEYPSALNEGVILQNYTYLMKSDILLVNLDRISESIGSIWEICLAWEYKKPVIAFGECSKWKDSPHFQSLCSIILPDIESACEYILSMYDML